MKIYLDCLPCFLRQALVAARRATGDERVHRDVIDGVASSIPTVPFEATPVELGAIVHGIVREVTGVDDPYRETKRRDNERVCALLPRLRARVNASSDPMLTALQLATAGNIIDFGADVTIDLDRAIERTLTDGEGLADYPRLNEELASAGDVLYIGDNAGEIALDRLVVEQLVERGVRVRFAVRGRPIINDVTFEDAVCVGMQDLAEIVTSGSEGPGTSLARCDPAFVDLFERSSLILSKGQGNFEGLSDEEAPLFFLLTVKCPVVARELGVEMGKTVLRARTKRSS